MIKWQSLIEADHQATIVHRLDPRTKIILLLFSSILVVFLDNPLALALPLCLAMIGFAAARISLLRLKIVLGILLLGLWGAVFSQALFYAQLPRTVVWVLVSPDVPVIGTVTKGIYIYKEGIVHGLRQGLRMADMTALGLLVCWTTEARALLLGLVHLRVPYSIAFMVVTAVRFIPILIQETSVVLTARRLRGGGRFRLQALVQLLSPILANCLRRAGTLAVAVESRAFRAYDRRTYLDELRFSIPEKFCLVIGITVVFIVVVIKVSYFCYQYGLFYDSGLRPVYDIAKTYL